MELAIDNIVIDRTSEQLINAIDMTQGNDGENSAALGGTADGEHSIAIGKGTSAEGTSSIAIGDDGTRAADNGEVAIGSIAKTDGSLSVAVGSASEATYSQSTAIGALSKAKAYKAVQIGEGTNTAQGTCKIYGTTLLDATGKIPFSALQGSEVVGLEVNQSNHLIVTYANGTTVDLGAIGGGGGTGDYDDLTNHPQVNGNTLIGNKTSAQLGLQSALVSGTNIKTVNGESILGSGNIKVLGLMPSQAYQYSSAVGLIADTTIPQGWYTLEQSITLDHQTFNAGELLGIFRDAHGGVIAYIGGNIFVYDGTVDKTHYLEDIDLEDYYNKDETDNLLAGKQNTLTFDSTPTTASTNPVTSAGIKTYVDTAIGDIDTALQGLISGGGVQ